MPGWRTAVAAVVLAAVCGGAGAAASAEPDGGRPPVVGHVGRWLVDARGRVLLAHGFDVVMKRAPYEPSVSGFDADDAAFLAGHGFTAVRLGVLPEGVEPRPGVFDVAYLRNILGTVDLLGRYGIRSLLDFHQDLYTQRYGGEGLPGWMARDGGLPPQPQAGFPGDYFAMPALQRAFDSFWTDAAGPRGIGLQGWYAAAWAHVAAYGRDDPAVLGYDLMNEPWPGSQWPTCFPPNGCPVFDRELLAPFVGRMVRAIRAVDRAHLVFYEPALPFDYSAPTWLGSVGGARSGFDFHVYCLAAVGAPETPPTRTFCDRVEADTVANAEHQSAVSGSALLLSEFGSTRDTAELRGVVALADRQRLPWLEWAYCACGDPAGSGTAEALVLDPRRPPAGSNVVRSTLAVLEEAYPQAVAGVPLSYGYDPATRTFRLRYTTARAGGGAFAAGTATDVWLPAAQFGSRYRVVVQGARVVSAPGARLLQLVACVHSAVVSLEVRPG